METITPEDLVRYMYHETSPEKTAAINSALQNDWSLREQFEVLQAAQNQLEDIKLSPGDKVLEKILHHAGEEISQLHH